MKQEKLQNLVASVAQFAVCGFFLLPAAGLAQTAEAPATTCIFRDVVVQEITAAAERGARIGTAAEKSLDSLQTLVTKANKPNVPLADQLPKADRGTFETLRKQLGFSEVFTLIERRRIRDLEIANKMVALSDQSYRFGIEPLDESADGKVLSAVRVIRDTLEVDAIDINRAAATCDLDGAVFEMQKKALVELSGLNLALPAQIAQGFVQKYGMELPVKEQLLDPADRAQWSTLFKTIVLPSMRLRAYVLDLESARIALRASETIYKSDLDDAVRTGGDINVVGTSIKKQVEAGALSKPTVTAMGIWRLLNEVNLVAAQ